MAQPNVSISDLLKKSVPAAVGAAGKSEDEKTPEEKLSEKMHLISLEKQEEVAQTTATQFGLRYMDLRKFPIPPEALQTIPEEDARKFKAIPFFAEGAEARVGVVDIRNVAVQQFLAGAAQAKKIRIVPYVITDDSFNKAAALYAALPKTVQVTHDVSITEDDLKKFESLFNSLPELSAKMKEVNITDFVSLIMSAAFKMRASDIHVEAEEKKIIVRLRLDGILHEIGDVPHVSWKKIISRIKLLSGLKINIEDKPQDGRITLVMTSGKIDVRVSTIPTAYGESVVMRILRPPAENVTFQDLGIRGRPFEQLAREIDRPNGMVITTGPTGSGKTTTLYTVLKKKNTPGVKIITLEDPIEYKLEGINQSQIDQSKGYTFVDALKSILRQDPDICMVGEIRDLPTAEVAIQAALTGHLLLSTIHTNSAAGAVPRFLSMGVKPFLLAPALNAVIGQRLVRRLCDSCKRETQITPEEREKVAKIMSTLSLKSGATFSIDQTKFFAAPGCDQCKGLGYKGRVGIYEIFTMSPEVEKIILSGNVSEYDMEKVAVEQGMVTMAQDGILKAADGMTALSEVFRVSE